MGILHFINFFAQCVNDLWDFILIVILRDIPIQSYYLRVMECFINWKCLNCKSHEFVMKYIVFVDNNIQRWYYYFNSQHYSKENLLIIKIFMHFITPENEKKNYFFVYNFQCKFHIRIHLIFLHNQSNGVRMAYCTRTAFYIRVGKRLNKLR